MVSWLQLKEPMELFPIVDHKDATDHISYLIYVPT